MLLERFVNGRVRSNAYVYAPVDRRALIVDAGPGAAAKIADLVAAEELEPHAIVLTHGHPDHIWTARALSDRYEIPAYIHPADLVWFTLSRLAARGRRVRPHRLELVGDATIQPGGLPVDVLHTPGHSGGSVCYRVDDLCFAGDTVFLGGVGQTAFPGGSRSALKKSIRSQLLPLPDELRLLPGHGRETTVGAERQLWNRFAGSES